jgi:hypothetical protein
MMTNPDEGDAQRRPEKMHSLRLGTGMQCTAVAAALRVRGSHASKGSPRQDHDEKDVLVVGQ